MQSFWKNEHFFQLIKRCYFELKKKSSIIGGLYVIVEPHVLVLDLDFVKSVFVKDYQYFLDPGYYINERNDPLSLNLLSAIGDEWKDLRYSLSPSFTSGKIKLMLPVIQAISAKLIKCIEIQKNDEVGLSDYLSRFTIDTIGSCAFGVDCDSLSNIDSDFLVFGRKSVAISKGRIAKYLFTHYFPSLAGLLGFRWTLKDVEEFYTKLILDVVAHRERNNVKRNDFLDLMLQLKNKGRLDDEKNSKGLTVNRIIANAYILLLAGYHSSSSVLKFCLLELAQHKDYQNRLRNEIRTIFKHNSNITYEKLMEMTYLDQVIKETMRKHPPFGSINRSLIDNYKVPNKDLTLEKGTPIVISVLGIHHDPDIYPEPEKFDPDRFTPDAIKSRHSCAFLAFGCGPRNCIGMKFAMMQMKMGLVSLMMNYEFSPSSRTQYPIKYSKETIAFTPVDGCWLKIERI